MSERRSRGRGRGGKRGAASGEEREMEQAAFNEIFPPWWPVDCGCRTDEDMMKNTAAIVLPSAHGQLRRLERNISKKDLKRAVEFGVKKLCGNDKHGQPRYSYTYADVTYITDSTSTKGKTGLHIKCCWIVAERVFHMFHIDNVNMRRGEETIVLKSTILVTDEHNSTHFSSPLLLNENNIEITSWAVPLSIGEIKMTQAQNERHEKAVRSIRAHPERITSHSVVIVDQSGSMKKQGSPGFRNRSDTVWCMLALEYIAERIEDGTRGENDVVSIVAMKNGGAEIIVHEEPYDYVLFNKVVSFRYTQRPSYDGNYIPALEAAYRLLLKSNALCALHLLFFSDGRPSDFFGTSMQGQFEEPIFGLMRRIGKQFGPRLTVSCIAISSPAESQNSRYWT